ncbi:phosphoribosylaminoimidazole carboxylase [Polaribacter ponticola]|uniref:Phosphoribosylaminoimidazole carboxylase n=1 Tax=Polaribacter ponticola TaxID=2978475 RepID=A0ABT5SED3_9FLAO|nr:phosphoribosylaminoimidazole carboxylase [Polaribacter sp. MSW5]MDD7915796.1 phosphoribosylaminoimidazole carboxylase [Polaribacter sp. MSW5]
MLKKILSLLCISLFINCSDTSNLANCIQTLPLNLVTDLNNPELINAQTPGGFAKLSGGNKGILLFNKNGTDFVAFDRLCPTNDCSNPMSFSNRILQCICDESKYSVDFGGAPQTDGYQCPAIEYRVIKTGSTIRISNF